MSLFARPHLLCFLFCITLRRLWEMDSHKVLGAGGEFADVVQFVETVRPRCLCLFAHVADIESDSQEHEALRAEQRCAAINARCCAFYPRRNCWSHSLEPAQRPELARWCVRAYSVPGVHLQSLPT
jgi:hypothetical protein